MAKQAMYEDVPVFQGLTGCQKKSLTAAGLTTIELLSEKTKEEVLALPRVGPKAIMILEANGVIFKA